MRVTEHVRDAEAHTRLLDAQERDRAAAFARPADRHRYLVAHVALRRLLGERLGVPPQDVVTTRQPCQGCGGPHGRPVVPGDPVHFSLSHSGDLVMIALAETPVGADVEEVPELRTVDDTAGMLHAAEHSALSALDGARRPAAFARCWTRKEAYLKATGAGLTEDLSATHVGAGPDPQPLAGWLITDHAVPHGYAAATAVRRPGGGPPDA
ncbi:4'-phosphopantetheinyl transferase family protein [Streptomyces sp. TR06-5]|uniref:4'-phosphopantetheinyl transferase family protein n=1 Tax=unclassified Streptomyces TaxID=2593676 RepID=UPI0039A17261